MTDSLTEKVARAMAVARVNATTNLPSAYPKSPLDQMAECSAHIDALAAHYLPDARAARESILAQIEPMLPDADKLDILATWLDKHDDELELGDVEREVQHDLYKWAANLRAMVRALREGE